MTTITTGTSGPKAWKIALVGAAVGLAALIAVNLPTTTDTASSPNESDAAQTGTADGSQTRSFFDENPATGRTPIQDQAPTGFGGPAPTPLVVPDQAQIDLLAPVITQQFLDEPSSAGQGATRVDPGAAAAVGLNPGAIDEIVGGTTRAVPTPDNLADAQIRAASTQATPAPSFAASDEALVNPVPEVDAATMIANIIAGPFTPARPPLAASDDALVRGASGAETALADSATNARWDALAEAYRNGTVSGYYTGDPDPVVTIPPNASAQAGTNARWEALHGAYDSGTIPSYYTAESGVTVDSSPQWLAYLDAVGSGTAGGYYQTLEVDPLIDGRAAGDPYLGGTSDDVLVRNPASVDPAANAFVGASPESAATERVPQTGTSIR